MTNIGGTPAGWYYAPGDPEGTQRYWDGAQWIGEPQAVPQAPAPPPPGGYPAPGAQPPAGQPPAYGGVSSAASSEPPPAYGVPAGYQNPSVADPKAGLAEISPRFVGYLIDFVPFLGVVILSAIGNMIADAVGSVILLVGFVAIFGYNIVYLQGTTGQTFGKEKQGVKLVREATGEAPGIGTTLGRYLVLVIPSFCTCGIVGLLDILWPLWDPKRQRLSDKIFKLIVVPA
ncbi:MAG: putative RDD family membrane protein YckC [Candidatus Aldehydirespiratoraceae bacterium]|jgi:uncharacterized RDD family membrane protein YckC